MWRAATWSWPSYGGAQCRGALYGGARLSTGGDKEGQPGDIVFAVDSYTPGVYGLPDITAFRHLERHAAVQ